MKKGTIDYILLFMILILLAIGITMVFSASYYYALNKWHDKFHFLKKELLWGAIGLIAMFIASNVPYRIYKVVSWPLTIVSTVFLGMTLIMGDVYNGAQRWLTLAGHQFMPSELAKIAMIIFFAQMLSSKKYEIDKFSDLFKPYLLVIAIIAALILKQPDYSTTAVIVTLALSMMYIAGTKFIYFLPMISVAIVAGWYFIAESTYRMQRFLTFLDPFADPMGSGWQIVNSLYALGSGGLFGVGLGQSTQNKLYIPEPQNDFIVATLGEEFGFIGTLLLMSVFIILIYRGFNIAKKTNDMFGKLLAYGITFLVAIQTIINIGVSTSLLPVTGMPLPFISFGGTSLVILMGSMGILLNISKYIDCQEEKL
ncbi:MAG: putative lipid II flippase FtsW [Clostridiales bacterium]|nr:putative lipid II flippase FtsW [Clostridiales bacterium]